MGSRRNDVRQQFDSVAGVYSGFYTGNTALAHLFKTRLRRVAELAGNLEGKDVLSIGCAVGMSADLVIAQNRPFYGVDISLNMLKECLKLFSRKGQLYLTNGDVCDLPFRKSSFDLVLCLGVMEYVDDVMRAFREIRRVMVDNGALIVSMQNKSSLYRWWDVNVYSSDQLNAIKTKLGRKPVVKPVETNYRLKDFEAFLANNRFKALDVVYYDFNIFLRPFDKYLARLSVNVSDKLERFYHNRAGILATGYIIKCSK